MMRTAYIVQAGFDFSPLKGEVEDVRFITSGIEDYSEMSKIIAKSMADFDPSLDVIIVAGKTMAAFMVGAFLGSKFPGKFITFGIYKSKISDTKFYEWEKFKV